MIWEHRRAPDLAAALKEAEAICAVDKERVLAAGDAYLRFHLEHPGAFRFLAFDGVEAGTLIEDLPSGFLQTAVELLQRCRFSRAGGGGWGWLGAPPRQ